MKDEWFEDPLGGYEENARHLFGYPESTLSEYLRDLKKFREWIGGSVGKASTGKDSAEENSVRRHAAGEGSTGEASGSGGPRGAESAGKDSRSGRFTCKDSAGRNSRGNDSTSRDWEDTAKLRLIWLTCSREDVERYLVHLSHQGLRATTINRKMASMNSFYVWAVHNRLVEYSPLAGIRKLKTPRRIPKFLTFEDIHKLLTYTGSLRRTATVRGKQVHAMISILYYLGVRRAELVDIRFEHIEKVTDSEIYLHIFGKGDKQRLVPFPGPAFEAYENFIRYRPESSFPHVFISLYTRHPMSKYNVNNVCDQLSRRVQLSKKLTPHLLRHTFATHLHLKGQPIEHINALLGHESLDTTKIYVHIDSGKLRESVEELVNVTKSFNHKGHKGTENH